MRVLGLTAALLGAMLAAQTHAADLPSNTLIQLQSRVFDMRVDAAKIRRTDFFIPITRVNWIYNLKNADPHLDPTVIHIRSYGGEFENLRWAPENINEYFTREVPVPDHLLLEGYEVLWQRQYLGERSGDITYFPKGDPKFFYVGCPYLVHEGWPKFCEMTLTYPPDPHLLIKVRIYHPTKPMNDFRAIAHKARTLVYCYLDVTDAVKAGTWEKTDPIVPPDEDFKIEECREFTS